MTTLAGSPRVPTAGGMLVMLVIETTSIGTDQWFGHAADPASSVASDALVPVFAVMTVIGLAALGAYLRGWGSAARISSVDGPGSGRAGRPRHDPPART